MNYSLRHILNVDLSDGSIRRESTEPDVARFVGGRGVGSKILYKKLPPHNDPLGPNNVLVLNTGPLSGTAAAASGRTDVSAQSPMNNFHGVTRPYVRRPQPRYRIGDRCSIPAHYWAPADHYPAAVFHKVFCCPPRVRRRIDPHKVRCFPARWILH